MSALKASNSAQQTNQGCWSHVLREHFTLVSKGIQEGQCLEQNPAVTYLGYRFSERISKMWSMTLKLKTFLQ